MKSNVLRAPLIKSAILLSIFSLLVYFTSTSAEGSVWSSLGAIFVLIFRTVQLGVGLALGLIVCLAVLVGIFLGAVALFNPGSASRMYEGLRQTILAWTAPVAGLFKSDRKEQLERRLSDFSDELQHSVQKTVALVGRESGAAVADLDDRLMAVASRQQGFEEESRKSAVRTQAIDQSLADTKKRLEALEGNLNGMQANVEKVRAAVDGLQPDRLLGDLPGRLEALEAHEHEEVTDGLAPITKQIAALQEELAQISKQVVETAQKKNEEKNPAAGEEEHRLLSYFDDPADREKLAGLVAGTLKKDMTYAQVMDYLADAMGSRKGKIITEHPSLAKDYIRQCRRG